MDTQEHTERYLRLIAAVVLAGEVAFCVAHRLANADYPHLTHVHGMIMDCALGGVWLAAAVFVLLKRTFAGVAVVLIAALASVGHGAMMSVIFGERTGFTLDGVPFIAAGLLITFVLLRTTHAARNLDDQRARRHLRATPTSR